MRQFIIIYFLMLSVFILGQNNAFAEFGVDWGKSFDQGLTNSTGDQILAQWLVDNGYYSNLTDAQNFAKTGYIGQNNAEADPFYWNVTQPTFEVVQENAGFADNNSLGFYTGARDSKMLTQIFNGTENGPKSLTINQSFGLYLETPQDNVWFTDRAENNDQNGPLKASGGVPQALIYELKPGQQWLVAWEDLDATQTRADRDYNDMYVKVTAGPEPIGSALFLIGSGVLTAARMRKKI